MHPELIEIPFVHLTVKSYGLMMVVGFLAAVTLIRYLSRSFTKDPQHITNAALYSEEEMLSIREINAEMFIHVVRNVEINPKEVNYVPYGYEQRAASFPDQSEQPAL